MVYREPSKREKPKPRGRPFAKGNKRGKIKSELLDTSGHESGDEGRVIANPSHSANVKDNNEESDGIELQLPKKVMETLEATLKEHMSLPQEEQTGGYVDIPEQVEKSKDLELIDSIEFKNGENTLTIRFSKKHNRMFRIQVFLNETSEIRPVTYTGASTGYAFWNLLKGALKK